MLRKSLSVFLSGALLLTYTPISALAAEKEDIDFIQSELEIVIDEDLEVNPQAAIGTLFLVPGVGPAVVIGVGLFAVGYTSYQVGTWIGDCINSFIEHESADKYISKNRKAGIRAKFPGQYLEKTLNEIEKDAKAGNSDAKTAKKLLTDGRWKK
ncbi:hypothetical protein [Sporosarcina limicola]|uniref:Uncharacterized protein n=1 Tax=Sporosarcina limicola TaxID=34101 RepID=A0A927MLP0_9BACL|nr:hypothetical protein [Sporosarcina limicola]MBE1555412.1 hypothetical protein [Sporosarcina limicola]